MVVCPLSVMANWEEQVKEHLKGLEALETDSDAHVKQEAGPGVGAAKKKRSRKGLRVAVYHGKDRGALKLQALQVGVFWVVWVCERGIDGGRLF